MESLDKQILAELEKRRVVESSKYSFFSWLLQLLPAPCPHLCSYRFAKPLQWFHFSCLTCPERVFHYKKRGHETMRRYQKVMTISESISGRGIILPKNYKAYTLIFNLDRSPSYFRWLRDLAVKMLLTVAERIAEW